MHVFTNDNKGNSFLGLTGQLTTYSVYLHYSSKWQSSDHAAAGQTCHILPQPWYNGHIMARVHPLFLPLMRWFTVFTRQRKTVHKFNQCLTWKIKLLFLYCSYWHTFWKCALHKKKKAISFLKEISFTKAWFEVNVWMKETLLDLKLNWLLEAKLFMFILFTFPSYDGRNKQREEASLVMERHITLTFRR